MGTITRSGLLPYALGMYEGGNKLYVADGDTGHLLIYNGSTLALIDELTLTGPAGVIAINETTGKVYVSWTAPFEQHVAIISGSTNAVLDNKLLTGLPQSFAGFAVDPGLGHIYAAFTGTVDSIDASTNAVTNIVLVGSGLRSGIAVNTVTHEVFLSNLHYDTLDVINGSTLVASSLSLASSRGWDIAVNEIENKVYVTTITWNGYFVYDRDTAATDVVGCCNDATTLFFNPVSNTLFTDSEINARATIIDGATNDSFEYPMFSATTGVGIRNSTNHVYFAGARHISMLDGNTQMLEVIPVTNPTPSSALYTNVAVNQTTGRVFVINDADATHAITVVQDTDRLIRPLVYISSGGTGSSFTLNMLDPVTNTVVDSQLSYGTHGLAYSSKDGKLYEATYQSFTYLGALRIYKGVSSWMLQDYFDPGGNDPVVPALLPDGSRVYVTNATTNDVSVVDTATKLTATTIAVGHKPWGAAVAPDGSKVYVANQTDNNVSVIDTTSNTVTGTIPVGLTPWGVAINPAGTKVYVANSVGNTVSVIDAALASVVATVPVGATPHWLAVAPGGDRVYVSNRGGGTVSVIDTGTDAVIQTPTVGTNPEGVAVMPDNSAVYVVNYVAAAASSLSVIDPADYSVTPVALPTSSYQSRPVVIADPTSRIAGHVTGGGIPLVGATVRALQSAVEKGQSTTNQAGDYSIFNLDPGTYDVEFSAPGYNLETDTGHLVGVGETKVVNFTKVPDSNPVPVITLLSPDSGAAGGPDFALTIDGSGFLGSSLVRWNGVSRATTPLNSDQVKATILAGDIVAPGTANVTVFNPGPGGGASNTLTFSIIAPQVSLAPPSLGFASRALASTSSPQSVTLSNTGTADLLITSLVKSGANSGDFGLSHNCPLSPTPLAAAGSCSIDVTFTPTAAGPRKALVVITDNAPGGSQKVLLTGMGSALSVTPAAANFPDRQVGTTSPPSAVTVTNLGSSGVSIWSSAISGIHAVDFSRANSCPVPPATLAGGASCTLNVTFTPGALGGHSAPLSISHDGGGSPSTVALSGNGTAPPGAPSSTGSAGGTVISTRTGDRSRTRTTGSRTPRARQTRDLDRH